MIEVATTNESTVVSDAAFLNAMPAFQRQVTEQFCPVWGIDAKLTFYAKGTTPPKNSWRLSLADTSDQAGALGYHLTTLGVPYGYVFCKSDIDAGLEWSVTYTHELLELLADPYVMCVVDIPSRGGGRFNRGGTLLAQEVADAPEQDQFASVLPGADGKPIKLTDWVTPAWFGTEPPSQGYEGCKGLYDFGGFINQQFQILTGGYIGVRRYQGAAAWSTVQGQMITTDEKPFFLKADGTKLTGAEIPKFSRRDRRLKNLAEALKGPDPVLAIEATTQDTASVGEIQTVSAITGEVPMPAALLGGGIGQAAADASALIAKVDALLVVEGPKLTTILDNVGSITADLKNLSDLAAAAGLDAKAIVDAIKAKLGIT